jgi:ATP-dependent helicase/nuclease subunit B
MRIVTSTSAAARLAEARRFLQSQPSSAEVVIVGASRGAADDLARRLAAECGATFGITRFSLTELAARAAAVYLAGVRRTPATNTGAEAAAARAVFGAVAAGEVEYFGPVARTPGFPKALARTVHELRLAGVSVDDLVDCNRAARDVGHLLERIEEQLRQASTTDRAELFRLAARACGDGQVRWAALPVVLLDVPLDSNAERAFAGALVRRSPAVLATVPEGDATALEALRSFGPPDAIEIADDPAGQETDLANLRRFVFTPDRPAPRRRVGDVSLFSAPGEGREAVEMVRRALDEAARGVPFDEMAVFLRTPRQYLGLLEHACARGGVPAYFDRGTRRPDPSGRAFVALLACACEGLSARRFDEYLSLGQVPAIDGRTGGAGGRVDRGPESWPRDVVFGWSSEETDQGQHPDERGAADVGTPERSDSDEEAVVAGTLRSPWKWEELIVESAVVGGRTRADGKGRWRRRLDGLAAEFRYRIAELKREEPESARITRFERDLRNLAHLRAFALPIVDALADWPDQAMWGEWIERFGDLAGQTLRRPTRVLQTLAELRPMADVGPVSLDEARDVLHDRLVSLDWEPPLRRYGRLFVGTPLQARGRSFRVVFVPGLAERVVPQRPREDPLLLDAVRDGIPGTPLARQDDRAAAERLLLKIAIGAASERLYLSYPRLDVAETRARVPSFYALDVMRAITGSIPDHRVLAADAAQESGASLAWPAPADPDRAIDDLEHDLSSLKPLLDSRDPASVKGHAHYLLALNEALRRSVISRWARGRTVWSSSDGLMASTDGVRKALQAHRLAQRPYSLSALQRFASCPYQFLLATIHRLEPWDEPEPVVRMDPLTRGSLFHRAQAEFYRRLEAEHALPVTRATLPVAVVAINEVLDRVASEYAEKLAPAIERVWRDEIDDLRRDLGIWVQKLADEEDWQPALFEFSFGLNDEGRDPRSLPDPITVDGRFVLRGSVDLVERHRQFDVLRITDHKTGKNRSNPDLIVGGGGVLQPVLYSMAIEQGLGKKVMEGRLFYCTTAGGFADHKITINDYTRGQGLEVLTIVDRAIEQGFLPAAPADRACTWCDFRPICGPREEERVGRKAPDKLADLLALRAIR